MALDTDKTKDWKQKRQLKDKLRIREYEPKQSRCWDNLFVSKRIKNNKRKTKRRKNEKDLKGRNEREHDAISSLEKTIKKGIS